MEAFIFFFTAVGFILSVYGFFVGQKINRVPTYRPLCDIKYSVSCSRAFNSPEARLIGFLPNTLLGIFFYVILAFFIYRDYIMLALFLSVVSSVVSLYLGYVLVRQKNFCIVCIATYLVNLAILYGVLMLQ